LQFFYVARFRYPGKLRDYGEWSKKQPLLFEEKRIGFSSTKKVERDKKFVLLGSVAKKELIESQKTFILVQQNHFVKEKLQSTNVLQLLKLFSNL
jgi:hypothetical protein